MSHPNLWSPMTLPFSSSPLSFPIPGRIQPDFFTCTLPFKSTSGALTSPASKGPGIGKCISSKGWLSSEKRFSVTNLPPAVTLSREQSVYACKHVRSWFTVMKWQLVFVQHLPPLSGSHVSPRSTILLAARHREWISPCDPSPAGSKGSLTCLFPISLLAWLWSLSSCRPLPLVAGVSALGSLWQKMRLLSFIHCILLYTKMMWWCEVSLCTALSPPNPASGWFGCVLWDKTAVGLGTDWLRRSGVLGDIPASAMDSLCEAIRAGNFCILCV